MELSNSILLQCICSILWILAKGIQVNVSCYVKYLDHCFFWGEVCRISLIEIVREQRHLNKHYLQNPVVNFRCVHQQRKLIKIETSAYERVILLATLITLGNEKGIILYGWKPVNLFINVYFERIFVRFIVIQLLKWKSLVYEVIVLSLFEPFREFNLLLTVHHAVILGNCPTWRKNSFQCIYLFIVLYMFRACLVHHQEKQIVSIQLLVIVTTCWWQCRVLVGSKLPTNTRHCHQQRVTINRSCIDTICFSWWWTRYARNM